MFEDLILEYLKREPPGTDTWNPLNSELELWHRVRLFQVMDWMFHQLPSPLEAMKILDVGCGVGRSSRMLLDFGARPGNIVGIDLRPDAIAYARTVNPGISFQVIYDFEGWPIEQSFQLCMQCTVFSSIKGMERRFALAAKMESMIEDGGYIFWWDAIQANPIGGGDPLEPCIFFKNCEMVASQLVSLQPSVVEAIRRNNYWAGLMACFLQNHVGYAPSHYAVLLKKD